MTEIPEGEPVRWLDDPGADPGLRADLAHGAGAMATGVDYAASLGALRAAMATTGPVATVGGASAGVATSSMTLKVGLAALAIAGAAAWWLGTRPSVEDAPVAAATERAPEQDDRIAPVVDDRGAATREDTPTSRDAAPAIAPAPGLAEPATDPGAERVAEPVADPVADPAVAPVVDPVGDAANPADDPTTDAARRVKRPVEDDDDRFVREAKLVATARNQLATDPKAALASTRRHAREFPRGALVEESAAIEVRALAQLRKADEAARKAAEFLARYPDGPHASAVRRAIEP